MKHAFAHDAVLVMEPGSDDRAPGAAVTLGLCGHLDHPPPCPLAAHHTAADRRGDRLVLRILFATEPDREEQVRERIVGALRAGGMPADPAGAAPPDGAASRWSLERTGPGVVAEAEGAHAARLAAG